MEIWKDIDEYQGLYEVSNKGNVRNKKTGRILKADTINCGYLRVCLYKKNSKKKWLVHRLVAQAFISNPDNKPCVDHIDGNRTNNNVNNLRWCTYKENNNNPITREKHLNALKEVSKIGAEASKKKVFCITTGELFNSVKEATEYYGLRSASGISDCCNGRQKTAGKLPDSTKLEWKYID